MEGGRYTDVLEGAVEVRQLLQHLHTAVSARAIGATVEELTFSTMVACHKPT